MIWNEIDITDKIDITGGTVCRVSKEKLNQVIPQQIKDTLGNWEFGEFLENPELTFLELYEVGGKNFIKEESETHVQMRSNLYRIGGYRNTEMTDQELTMFLDLFVDSIADILGKFTIEEI